jgi:hypothetical protein
MSNRLTLFAGAALVLVGLTAFLTMQADHRNELHEQPALAFPKLAASGQEVSQFAITSSSSKVTLVKQTDGAWLVEEMGRYPAKIDLINRLYLDLSTLSLLEKRSAKAENQAAMGLDAPGSGGAGIEIKALDKSGAEMAGIIQGKVKDLSANGTPATLFVRRIGDNQAWFARSNLQASAAPGEWVDKLIMSILGNRLSLVELRPNGPDPVVLRRDRPDSPDINLVDVPKGRKQDSAQISALSQALNALTFESVKPKADVDMTGATIVRYRLFEGPVIDVRVKRIDGKTYAAFSAGSSNGLSDTAMKEVADINARTSPFVYVLPGYKADVMTPSKEALLQKPETAAPAKVTKP